MSLNNQLDQADLAKRTKELDARAEAIIQKENLLAELVRSKTGEIEVLDGKIRHKTAELEDLKTQASDLEAKYSKEVTKLAEDILSHRQDRQSLEAEVSKLLTDKETASEAVRMAKQEASSVEAQITDRRRYLDEQERTVNSTIEGWNDELRSLASAVNDAEFRKDSHLKDIVRLEQSKTELEAQLDLLTNKLGALQKTYDDKATELRGNLKLMDRQIEQRQEQLDNFYKEQTSKLGDMKRKEQELTIREEALAKNGRELADKERRLKSQYSMLGVKYD